MLVLIMAKCLQLSLFLHLGSKSAGPSEGTSLEGIYMHATCNLQPLLLAQTTMQQVQAFHVWLHAIITVTCVQSYIWLYIGCKCIWHFEATRFEGTSMHACNMEIWPVIPCCNNGLSASSQLLMLVLIMATCVHFTKTCTPRMNQHGFVRSYYFRWHIHACSMEPATVAPGSNN